LYGEDREREKLAVEGMVVKYLSYMLYYCMLVVLLKM